MSISSIGSRVQLNHGFNCVKGSVWVMVPSNWFNRFKTLIDVTGSRVQLVQIFQGFHWLKGSINSIGLGVQK